MRKSILVNRLLAQLQAHATATNTSILRGTRTAMRKLIVVVLPAHSQNYTAVVRRSLENRRPTTMRKFIPINRLLAQLQAHTTARSTSSAMIYRDALLLYRDGLTESVNSATNGPMPVVSLMLSKTHKPTVLIVL